VGSSSFSVWQWFIPLVIDLKLWSLSPGQHPWLRALLILRCYWAILWSVGLAVRGARVALVGRWLGGVNGNDKILKNGEIKLPSLVK
jgi:hypothetical protein